MIERGEVGVSVGGNHDERFFIHRPKAVNKVFKAIATNQIRFADYDHVGSFDLGFSQFIAEVFRMRNQVRCIRDGDDETDLADVGEFFERMDHVIRIGKSRGFQNHLIRGCVFD